MQISATGTHHDRGFTLIELLVVICVMGLLSAAGAVVLAGRDGLQLSQQTLAMIEFFKAARRTAQATGKAQQVNVGPASLSVASIGGVPVAMPKQPRGIIIRLRNAPQRAGSREAIVFYPDGSSTGGLVDLTWKGETRRVVVDWWGRVDVAN